MANKHCVVIREMPSQNAVDYRFGVFGADIDNGHVVGGSVLRFRSFPYDCGL